MQFFAVTWLLVLLCDALSGGAEQEHARPPLPFLAYISRSSKSLILRDPYYDYNPAFGKWR